LSTRRPNAKPPAKNGASAKRLRAAHRPATTTADEIQALSGDPNFMTSLARGLAVIRGFSQQRRKMSIAQLSLRTGIPRAAVRRCLYTFAKLGYVGAEDGGTFALRPQILSLGHAYLSSVPLVMAAQPILDQELEIGLRSIAVPVKDYRGRVEAAINISVHAARVSGAEMEKAFLPPLRDAADELGMLAG